MNHDRVVRMTHYFQGFVSLGDDNVRPVHHTVVTTREVPDGRDPVEFARELARAVSLNGFFGALGGEAVYLSPSAHVKTIFNYIPGLGSPDEIALPLGDAIAGE